PFIQATSRFARALVVYRAYGEHEQQVARLMYVRGICQDDAEEEAPTIFQIMREKVQRFMTRTTGHAEAEPTPMDWIYEARTYGMHIRFNTPTAGSIDWVGEQITYRKVRFTMTDLSEMLHALK
ncbi:hypothetical protein IWW34DRAFT_584668, partial [Fusarium oxysporum f. sp. albedinis]